MSILNKCNWETTQEENDWVNGRRRWQTCSRCASERKQRWVDGEWAIAWAMPRGGSNVTIFGGGGPPIAFPCNQEQLERG